MKCTVCGQTIPEGQTICSECGTQVSEEVSQPKVAVASGTGEAAPPAVAPTPPAPSAPSVPVPMARLLFKFGGMITGQEFPLGGRVIVGRFHEETGPVDIDLSNLSDAGYVSRRHAEIYPDASGQWFVKDLGSKNGTFVLPAGSDQFRRVPPDQPVPINDGDEIAFGNVRFVFRTQGGRSS